MEKDNLKSGLYGKNKLLTALDDQSINTEPRRYTFTKNLLTGDAKVTINQTALDIGIHTVDYFTRVLSQAGVSPRLIK